MNLNITNLITKKMIDNNRDIEAFLYDIDVCSDTRNRTCHTIQEIYFPLLKSYLNLTEKLNLFYESSENNNSYKHYKTGKNIKKITISKKIYDNMLTVLELNMIASKNMLLFKNNYYDEILILFKKE